MTPDEIRSRREAAGMTPEDLSAELGISTRTLARMESGVKDPTKAELIALDWIFSVQVGAKSASATTRKAHKR